MDHSRARQGRPSGLPMAHQEVHRPERRVSLCSCGSSNARSAETRRHAIRRSRGELGHHEKECSFEAILKTHRLAEDAALRLLAKIVNGADTDNSLWHQPESAGLKAIAEGFRHLNFRDDHEINAAEWIVYDALYAYCKEMVKREKP